MGDMLLQAGLSLAAILALFGIAAWLGLGRGTRIADAAHAKALAQEADGGFEPVDALVGRDGRTALVRGDDDRFIAIKVHGAHFAARPVSREAIAIGRDGTLAIASGDRLFGRLAIALRQPPPDWLTRAQRVD
ncbi:hypothetical protein F7D01_07210 [Erythrobacter sp. 3-20A1M]|uniref:hypothetical protein n=1 Tax=Erythrobacter sp. 3-20A1M TaxID=2653850 RepID=UPI001BFC875F|nr:hypothetical protein [Erythrobacter sp. 3-20A1M]QWC56912.1 hypothetical protein F7D01_07210 [Erythrobacter sp. 3-20A1M]